MWKKNNVSYRSTHAEQLPAWDSSVVNEWKRLNYHNDNIRNFGDMLCPSVSFLIAIHSLTPLIYWPFYGCVVLTHERAIGQNCLLHLYCKDQNSNEIMIRVTNFLLLSEHKAQGLKTLSIHCKQNVSGVTKVWLNEAEHGRGIPERDGQHWT